MVVGLIGAAFLISKPWVTIQHAEPIMVKGYAESEVSADQGSLTVRISEKGEGNGEAYDKAGESLDTVRALVNEVLGEEVEMVELSSSLSETKKLNEKGKMIFEYKNILIGSMKLKILTYKQFKENNITKTYQLRDSVI